MTDAWPRRRRALAINMQKSDEIRRPIPDDLGRQCKRLGRQCKRLGRQCKRLVDSAKATEIEGGNRYERALRCANSVRLVAAGDAGLFLMLVMSQILVFDGKVSIRVAMVEMVLSTPPSNNQTVADIAKNQH